MQNIILRRIKLAEANDNCIQVDYVSLMPNGNNMEGYAHGGQLNHSIPVKRTNANSEDWYDKNHQLYHTEQYHNMIQATNALEKELKDSNKVSENKDYSIQDINGQKFITLLTQDGEDILDALKKGVSKALNIDFSKPWYSWGINLLKLIANGLTPMTVIQQLAQNKLGQAITNALSQLKLDNNLSNSISSILVSAITSSDMNTQQFYQNVSKQGEEYIRQQLSNLIINDDIKNKIKQTLQNSKQFTDDQINNIVQEITTHPEKIPNQLLDMSKDIIANQAKQLIDKT